MSQPCLYWGYWILLVTLGWPSFLKKNEQKETGQEGSLLRIQATLKENRKQESRIEWFPVAIEFFYILLPNKASCSKAGVISQAMFFKPSWICWKMTSCWGKSGFLTFPHASESLYSDMLILQVIWSAPGNINNFYSKSCTLFVMCKRPAFPIATWKWEIQMEPFWLPNSETIRQCQLREWWSHFFRS